uniref:Uncharacterized protein n=1 Tax=Arundo donax TaxID=35708 RepID=A0A0A9HTK8_ARUDO
MQSSPTSTTSNSMKYNNCVIILCK